MIEVKINLHENGVMPTCAKLGDWYDLYTAETTSLIRGKYQEVSLGISMELPKGYEAIVAPRSSTYKRYGCLFTNSIGIIDEGYKGDNDIWHLLLYATRNCIIPQHTRIAQFRVIEHQPVLFFKDVNTLGNKDRGGIGSTGV